MELLNMIGNASNEQIGNILDTAMKRYNELYPDWEINLFSIPKGKNKDEHIDNIVRMLTQLKD